ncbi:MAG: ROK family protein [Propionibacteriaceae bacterium]|nr:ROK family protein [Propionibacteriaceae bacterium]
MGTASRRELAEATGLSFATVAAISADLLTSGVLTASAPERNAVGRPTARLQLNGERGVFLALDIVEDHLEIATYDSGLRGLSRSRVQFERQFVAPDELLSVVRAAIRSQAEVNAPRTVIGIGVSAPGVVDPVTATWMLAPPWQWRQVTLADLADDVVDHADSDGAGRGGVGRYDATARHVALDNPQRMLATAELWSNPVRADQTFVVLSLGAHVTSGIAINGRLLRGRTNTAGQWGHSVLVAGGRPCHCGSYGCVETYLGAEGILRTLRDIDSDSPLLNNGDTTTAIEELARAVVTGDPVANKTVDRTGHYLGAAIASMVNLLNPDAVVLTGWIGELLGAYLLGRARTQIETCALDVPLRATMIELGRPSTDQVCLGAAAEALERSLIELSRERIASAGSAEVSNQLAEV